MKKASLKVLAILIFSISFNAVSQYVSPPSIQHKTIATGTFDLSYKNLVGSVYISDTPKPANISLAKKNYPTRYDAYHDEMEILEDNKPYYLPKTFDCIVNFDDKKYVVYHFNLKDCFFVELVKGEKISLLLKEKIKLIQEKEGNGIVTYQPPTLKRSKDKIFVSIEKNKAIPLPKKKKEFFKLFSPKSKEIEKYAKEQKLSIKSTNDLIEIFKFYNTL